jgi:hypothetical protein
MHFSFQRMGERHRGVILRIASHWGRCETAHCLDVQSTFCSSRILAFSNYLLYVSEEFSDHFCRDLPRVQSVMQDLSYNLFVHINHPSNHSNAQTLIFPNNSTIFSMISSVSYVKWRPGHLVFSTSSWPSMKLSASFRNSHMTQYYHCTPPLTVGNIRFHEDSRFICS